MSPINFKNEVLRFYSPIFFCCGSRRGETSRISSKGLTLGELLIASTIAIIVIGGAFALWFMTQDTWTNERTKSEILQKLQVTIERIKREMKISDGSKMFFHSMGGVYDAVSFPIALDDGRSDTGYSATQNGDGFIETDSSSSDPITGVEKIWWDKTVIYHVYYNATEDKYELGRTTFYPRDNTLTAAERQDQLDKVVSLGTGNHASVPNFANWESTRAIFKTSTISFEIEPRLREFDGYSSATERTESLIDFGSAVLSGGYHTIKFKVTDKNPDSTGYAFGIDLLKFTPPGSLREGENYKDLTHPDSSSGISGSSGDTTTVVNMHESEYGLWSADYYLNYAANAINDYIDIRFYYDRWYETTFSQGVCDKVVVEFNNIDGRGGVSGNKEWLLRLEGNEDTWDSSTQTQTTTPQTLVFSDGGVEDITYRNLIMTNYITASGMMLSIKFHAGNSYPLTIASAYIIQREDKEGASPDDGDHPDPPDPYEPYMPSIPITFDNCELDPRNAGQSGLVGSGNSVTIPAGGYAWSNWIQLYDNNGVNFNFDKTRDYFISFYIPDLPADEPKSIWYWQDTTSAPATHSYTRDGQVDDVAAWGGTGTPATSIYGVEEIAVRYVDSGSYTSQVFDTGVENPAYGTMKWTSIVNSPDAALQIRVRTSDDKSALEADGDWTAITGQTFTSSPASLSAIGTGRYIQFKAELAADEDYDITSVLKDISIYWPGNTTMVDVGGYFTKKPDYGIFTVEIDGQQLIKGFVINLSITETLTTGETVSRSISAEIEPRNTNK